MNAIHPILAQALAPVTPPAQFDVKITFTDGVYQNKVSAYSADQAKLLAVIDARMASPFRTFYGALVSQDASEVQA